MFENLTERLGKTLKNISGQGRLTEKNIDETLQEVRSAFLEADVALPVITQFLEMVKNRALGQEVLQSLSPGEAFIKVVNDELIQVMGETASPLNFNTQPPAVILMAGLQGSGKTTTTAKLANYIKNNLKKSVMVVSTDVYRPAAIQQLETLAHEINVAFHPASTEQKPLEIAQSAISSAKKTYVDVVLVDTAGRLHIDEAMMDEIKQLHTALKPVETLFVVDSMTGQDAANTAKVFHDALPLTGVVLTKADGDARGGAALSVRLITGKPIKFMGVGEKIEALEPFYPDRLASRILGMGDILSLVEEVERKVDMKKAEQFAKKMKKGKSFDLEDFRDQLMQMNNMGGISSLIDKLPGMGNIAQAAKEKINDKSFQQMVAIINSMTPQERRFPALIKASRKLRISAGSGTQVQDINRLLKQFMQMQKMMKRFSKKGNMMRMMQSLQNMKMPGGGVPPNFR